MSDITPVFYDHSSQKSILTWWGKKDWSDTGPVSILQLAQEANLKQVFFVSKNFHTFNEARLACESNALQLVFGLELWVTDSLEKNEQSSHNESKIIIWLKNSSSYKDAIKIYSKIHTDINNKYYHYRTSWGMIKSMWTENLMLGLPTFDSFIHKNLLHYGASIIPDLPCDPIIHREVNSGIPFVQLINLALDKYNIDKKFLEIKTKTIMYRNYKDAAPYINYRAINNRADFGNPQIDFLCSDKFCFEDYTNLIK
jgi:hypothetical protein